VSLPRLEDAKFYFEADMERCEVFSTPAGEVGVYSCRCPGKETSNEDVAAILPYGERAAVLVVADGLGGVPAGEQASRLATEALQRSVQTGFAAGMPLRDAIINGIEEANVAVQALAIGTGTTIAVAEIHEDEVRSYHVGDSMILVSGQRGKLKMQTISHSPVGYGVEAGLIDESAAMRHEDRHVVSNVIGSAEMRIELGPSLRLGRYDTVLLATDGLFDNLETPEIVEHIRKGPLSQVAECLWRAARGRMDGGGERGPSKSDDLTLLVFRRASRGA
jgi:serine/threonine protein phosphatase PrpC